MRMLTQKQKSILDFIKDFVNQNNFAPTLEEIGNKNGITSRVGVLRHIVNLENKGLLIRNGRTRGITLIDNDYKKDFCLVPILGFANAGKPLVEADEEMLGNLEIDKNLLHGASEVFAVQVKGDSMDLVNIGGVNLLNGYYAIVAKDVPQFENDVVLAVIDNGATLKVLKEGYKKIILSPNSTNPIHKPIYVGEDSNCYINGKVIAVLEN